MLPTTKPLPQAVDDGDLLDFVPSAEVRTPGVGDGTTTASWVAEMNAELAEFDALTSSATPESLQTGLAGDPSRWKQELEQELGRSPLSM